MIAEAMMKIRRMDDTSYGKVHEAGSVLMLLLFCCHCEFDITTNSYFFIYLYWIAIETAVNCIRDLLIDRSCTEVPSA